MNKYTLLFIFCFFISAIGAQQCKKEGYLVMDMVHHNPGEAMTQTSFRDPGKLASYHFNGMVINEFKFPQCAVSFDKLNKNIFPRKSPERTWINLLAEEIRAQIRECHKNGLQAFYFTDIIVLPKKLIELYKDEICDKDGHISFEKPKTWEIHKIMLDELFELFPEMDGLVIRTGETYIHNIPYHIGNGPVDYKNKLDESIKIHTQLLNLLREEVCVKRNKKIVYRTWDFGFFHTRPEYYLSVTDAVEPHSNLYIAVKHTQGDYFRTFPFNKTLMLGKHKQVVEVQCQREYEGKGAYPNYIANDVINGFEENKHDSLPRCLNDIKENPLFYGVWTWSRGGGWQGPYITNELWCDLNTYVMSHWAVKTERSEEEIFNEYAIKKGITPETLPYFRKLCLLTPDAIIRGRGSLIHPVNVAWTRDHFLGGVDRLSHIFDEIIAKDAVDEALYEMRLSVALWSDIVSLSRQIVCNDKSTEHYIRVSSQYGYLLYAIMEQGWIIMLKGYLGEKTGKWDKCSIQLALDTYDQLWVEYCKLKEDNKDCATLYNGYFLGWKPGGRNVPVWIDGMKASVDKYRALVKK
ncbi:hypothetical protein [Bacteroides difficilis]|uniref:hypothetical protein n=1 Tax=Bacteroides difficilis TaxID=2763021 RepID=UPI003AAD4463